MGLADHCPGAIEDAGVKVKVDTGEVGQRQAEPFRHGNERQLQLEVGPGAVAVGDGPVEADPAAAGDRKSTRLNSSHTVISYAVFCLKKKTKTTNTRRH